ncbi:MAG: oligosaccharide flippase family protein [Dysgonamonadaceae bacterium]|jgi:O-antigen/teichoic acid export membrane protein|nr:oligosaccharide flippase family protein [Dysgonamonadaceae bacterium]
MTGSKSLIKDSAIYGGSTILVKMISWLQTPLFTYTLAKSDFGMMTNLYAYVALIIVILTFGMETGFFRFVNQKEKYQSATVYSTTLLIVSGIALLFLAFSLTFLPSIRPYLWQDEIPDSYIRMVLIILTMDTVSAIPFAYLRYRKKTKKFGFLKLLNVVLYFFFCVFFLIVCPWINKHWPGLISWFWRDDFRLGYVFISNLLATGIQTLCLLPDATGFRYKWDGRLARNMLVYCFPLMIMGLAGMSNQVVDKLVFPVVYPDSELAFDELGVYGACFKIALIMMMFTQAFRYAYEPYVFEKSKDKNAGQSYADVMKYFIIMGLLVFLVVVFYLDIIKYFIEPEYFGALHIVPIVLIGELFFAVYFNLSFWYKLTDKTYWGAIFSTIASVVIIGINLFFIPQYGYMACAWAPFIGNGLIVLLSYYFGQKDFPVRYDLKTIGLYAFIAGVLFTISYFVPLPNASQRIAFNTILLAVYLFILIKRDLPLKEIPVLNRFIGKRR